MTVEDDLFDFFRTFISKIHVDESETKTEYQKVLRKMVIDDSYIPLITPDALRYIAGLNNEVLGELAERADDILIGLGFPVGLPDSYKVSTVMGLSLVVALRRLYDDKLLKESYVIARSEDTEIKISAHTLLRLYRFLLYTRIEVMETNYLDYFDRIYSLERKDPNVVPYAEKAIERLKSELEQYILKQSEQKAKESHTRKVDYTRYYKKELAFRLKSIFSSVLFLPLILAYVVNGATLPSYTVYSSSPVGFHTTILADYLIYSLFHADLRTTAERLLKVFSAVYRAVPHLSEFIKAANDELTSSILREVAISAIAWRGLYQGDDEVKAFYKKITKGVGLIDLLNVKPEPPREVLGCQPNVSSLNGLRDKISLSTGFTLDEIVGALSAGNLLFVGPPGTGKTRTAKDLVRALTGDNNSCYEVYTANSLWFRRDVIGGESIVQGTAVWRSGILIRAYVNAARVRSGLYYLILDEVNRADVDKAFGEFFTVFSENDPNSWSIPRSLVEEIESFEGRRDKYADRFLELYMDLGDEPLRRIRIIATMNLTDVRNTFYVGDAFARRFTIVFFRAPKGSEDVELIVKKHNLAIPNIEDIKGFVSHVREKLKDFVVSTASVERALILYSRLNDKTLDTFAELLKASLGTLNTDVLEEYDKIADEYLGEEDEQGS